MLLQVVLLLTIWKGGLELLLTRVMAVLQDPDGQNHHPGGGVLRHH